MSVSEQSPWGTPPPSNPYGPSQPQQPTPSYPQQPSYPTGPSGGGFGGGGPSYGPTYGGQPPKPPKRRTGLILGIVAAVVAVIAAFAITLVVASGDDEPGSAEDPTTPVTSSGSSSSPESPTTAETLTSPPGPTETESAGSGDRPPVTGDGYDTVLPADGWTDQTSEAGVLGSSETLDTVLVLGQSIELAQSNIIVEALTAGTASSIEDLEGLWKRNLRSTDGATTEDIADRTIDGERAIGVEIKGRVNTAGDPIKQIAYLTIHDGNQYSIGLSYPASGDSVSVGDFEIFLNSWKWTD